MCPPTPAPENGMTRWVHHRLVHRYDSVFKPPMYPAALMRISGCEIICFDTLAFVPKGGEMKRPIIQIILFSSLFPRCYFLLGLVCANALPATDLELFP